MNIQDLVTSYLLQHRECTLPGIGIFKVTHKPATFDEAQSVLLPAAEEIVFRETNSDDSKHLVEFISYKNGASVDEASSALKSFCDDAKEKIKSGGKLVIETFGSLQKNAAGNIYFTREKSPVYFIPIKAEVVYEGGEEEEPTGLEASKPVKSYWKLWAVILFAVAIGILIYHFAQKGFSIQSHY